MYTPKYLPSRVTIQCQICIDNFHANSNADCSNTSDVKHYLLWVTGLVRSNSNRQTILLTSVSHAVVQ